jgi:hypothetical protein
MADQHVWPKVVESMPGFTPERLGGIEFRQDRNLSGFAAGRQSERKGKNRLPRFHTDT